MSVSKHYGLVFVLGEVVPISSVTNVLLTTINHKHHTTRHTAFKEGVPTSMCVVTIPITKLYYAVVVIGQSPRHCGFGYLLFLCPVPVVTGILLFMLRPVVDFLFSLILDSSLCVGDLFFLLGTAVDWWDCSE